MKPLLKYLFLALFVLNFSVYGKNFEKFTSSNFLVVEIVLIGDFSYPPKGPFGQIIDKVEGVEMPYGYQTKYTDSETGLISWPIRYYDPVNGRFLNQDPISIAGGINVYNSCSNNMVNGFAGEFGFAKGMEFFEGSFGRSTGVDPWGFAVDGPVYAGNNGYFHVYEDDGLVVSMLSNGSPLPSGNLKASFVFNRKSEDGESIARELARRYNVAEATKNISSVIKEVGNNTEIAIRIASAPTDVIASLAEFSRNPSVLAAAGIFIPTALSKTLKKCEVLALTNRFPNLDRKFKKHGSEWGDGNLTKEAYRKRDNDLIDSKVGGDIDGFVSDEGTIFRYNNRTNEFATAYPDGSVQTLFRPTRGADYWATQINKYKPR